MLHPIGPLTVATPLVHCPWPRPWLSVPSASPVCGAQLPGDAGRVGLHGERVCVVQPGPHRAPRPADPQRLSGRVPAPLGSPPPSQLPSPPPEQILPI